MTQPGINVRRFIGWAGASQAGRVLIQLSSIVVLARLLNPEDFGVMAIALAISAFANLFRDLGTATWLIQREDLDDEVVGGIFRLNCLAGLLLAVLCATIARPLSHMFDEPRLAVVLFTISPTFLLTAVAVVPQALLERDSRFARLAAIELMATGLSTGIAVGAALLGFGVVSLAIQVVTAAALAAVALWKVSPWRNVRSGSIRSTRPMARFGANLLAFNLLNYIHRNADAFLIGRFLGTTALGNYSVGYKAILVPLQTLTFSVARVLLPAYSRFQTRRAEIRRHYLRAVGSIVFVASPLLALVWALREPIVTTLLGPGWDLAAAVVAWLAPVGLCQSIVSTSGSILSAVGRVDILRNLGALGLVVLVSPFIVGLPWGVVGVAAAYCVANIFWVFPVMHTVMRQLDGNLTELLASLWKPILIAVGMAAAARSSLLQLEAMSTPRAMFQLLVPGLIGIAVYLLGCVLLKVPEMNAIRGRARRLLRARR